MSCYAAHRGKLTDYKCKKQIRNLSADIYNAASYIYNVFPYIINVRDDIKDAASSLNIFDVNADRLLICFPALTSLM
jgi:hypothetical protein